MLQPARSIPQGDPQPSKYLKALDFLGAPMACYSPGTPIAS